MYYGKLNKRLCLQIPKTFPAYLRLYASYCSYEETWYIKFIGERLTSQGPSSNHSHRQLQKIFADILIQ